MGKYDRYYRDLEGATLQMVDKGQETEVFLLRKYPESHDMSTWLIFGPWGTIITGDLRPSGHGSIAPGYGRAWFSCELEPDYLAGKFLEKKWVPESAIESWKEQAELQKTEEDENEARFTWRVAYEDLENATKGDAMLKLLGRPDLFETGQLLYDNLPEYSYKGHWHTPFDGESIEGGHDYLEGEIGWLSAIQRKFSELYPALIKEAEAKNV
jgi:hypothetical protein